MHRFYPLPAGRGEGRGHLVVSAMSGGEAGARARGYRLISLIRSRPLTLGCRLDVLPDKGETRPSPRKRGEGKSLLAERIELDHTEKEAFGTRMLVAGIGFRHGAMPGEIVALIYRALAESGHEPDRLGAIATAEDRANKPSIVEAAAVFGLAPVGLSPAEMIAVDGRVPTRSGRIEASRGVGSVAEAAALAAAGRGGTLILPRIASPAVTCALALPAYFATQAG